MGSGYHSQWGQTPLIGSDPIIRPAQGLIATRLRTIAADLCFLVAHDSVLAGLLGLKPVI